MVNAAQTWFAVSGKRLGFDVNRSGSGDSGVLLERAGVRRARLNLLENARKYAGQTVHVGANHLEVRQPDNHV